MGVCRFYFSINWQTRKGHFTGSEEASTKSNSEDQARLPTKPTTWLRWWTNQYLFTIFRESESGSYMPLNWISDLFFFDFGLDSVNKWVESIGPLSKVQVFRDDFIKRDDWCNDLMWRACQRRWIIWNDLTLVWWSQIGELSRPYCWIIS